MRRTRNLKAVLAEKLDPAELELLCRSFDIIGDIAVIRVPALLKGKAHVIAAAVMQTHNHVKTVLRQASPVAGDLRLRGLEWVAGDKKTETLHKEFGCLFKVDLADCYFSPRLSHERMRIARQVQSGEVVVNMFAGVGAFSVLVARHSRAEKVYSIDISPVAVRYMRENIALNKVGGSVAPVLGDAPKVIEARLQNVADRVLMPLPRRAYEYLDWAVLALKPPGGWIHYYDFEHAQKDEDPIGKTATKVAEKLETMNINCEMAVGRVVRSTGPRWFQTVVDIKVLP